MKKAYLNQISFLAQITNEGYIFQFPTLRDSNTVTNEISKHEKETNS